MGRVGIASVLLLALVSGAWAEITVDEARASVEALAGVSLGACKGDLVTAGGALRHRR